MIEIQNLTFGYSRKQKLFRDLNLSFLPGNVYGLLGRNGAGKSSLLRNMAGLLFPDAGRCLVNGFDPKDRHPAFLRDVFFVPEEFYLPSVAIRNFVSTYAPFYPAFDRTQFARYLKEFEIEDRQTLTELSYGQKKKVLVGFALATNVKTVLMDEPTNGLDIPSKSQFRKTIASAVDEQRTIVISTHQVRDLESLIDPIVILDESEVLLSATIEQITQQLLFKQLTQIEHPERILYSESSFRGMSVVMENTDGELSKVDLELLFNAALAQKSRVRSLFSNIVESVR
jgi:ABC-2 type transport system ATP-binding protein